MIIRKTIQKDGELITAKNKWVTHYIPPRSLLICSGWFAALGAVVTIDYFHHFVGTHGDTYLLVWILGTVTTLIVNLYVERLLLLRKIRQQKENLHGLNHQYKLDQKEIQQLTASIAALNWVISIRSSQVQELSKQMSPETAQYIQNETVVQEQIREANKNV